MIPPGLSGPLGGAGDTGEPDAQLAAALRAWRTDPTPGARAEALAALVTARVFAAITATSTAEHVEPGTGLRAESSAEMALLTLVGSAGGRAVPLFLDAGGAVGFRPGARPVALPASDACTAALQDGAVAVLVDPPGAALVVSGAELGELAAGRVPIARTALSSHRTTAALVTPVDVDPALVAAVTEALHPEPVRAARLLQGPDGLVLGLVPTQDLGAAELAALAARVLPRLAGSLPAAGLDVAVVGPEGPGLALALAPPRRDATAPDPPRRRWLRRGR